MALNYGWRELKTNWYGWFHFAYASLVIVLALFNVWPSEPTLKENILLGAFLGYFGVLLIYFLQFTRKSTRAARFANAFEYVHSSLQSIRDAQQYLLNISKTGDAEYEEKKLKPYIINALTDFTSAFTLISGKKCRASIKFIGLKLKEEELYVTTLARDNSSETDKSESDRRDNISKCHLVERNTDFHLIFLGHDYFFNNNLPKLEHYMNTSITSPKSIDGDTMRWTLPYKSAIVWPIKLENAVNVENNGIYGFLTIDSSSRNAFEEQYDISLGSSLAASLCLVLKEIKDIKSPNN